MQESDRAAEPVEVNTSVKDAGTWAKALDVTVPVTEVDKEFNSVCGELANSVRLPGFRPGKVPRNVIEKKFGDDIKKQVTSNLLNRALRSAILKEKLDVIGEPKLDVETIKASRGEPLNFVVDVEVRPAFELGTYKGLQLEQEEIEVLPQEFDDAVDRIRERFAVNEDAPADHAIKDNNDTVKGVLRVLVDGNEVLKEDDTELLVQSGHVVGAYAHLGSQFLEGAKVGDKRTVDETLAGHFPVAEHRGKKATLEFEVKSIRVRNLPPLDDALAVKMNLKSADDLKEKIRTSLLDRLRTETERTTRETLVDKVVETTPFELPPRLLDSMSARTMGDQRKYFEQMGMPAEMFAGKENEMVEAAKKSATAEMRRFFILQQICEKENIGVDDDDVDQEIVKEARQRGTKASELYDKLVESGQIADLEHQIKTRKALDFLIENADIKIVPRKPVEVEKHDHAAHAPQSAGHGHEHGHENGHEHGHEHGHEQK